MALYFWKMVDQMLHAESLIAILCILLCDTDFFFPLFAVQLLSILYVDGMFSELSRAESRVILFPFLLILIYFVVIDVWFDCNHVQMSSAAGKTPAPGQAVYSASKYALNGYFHSLRSEEWKEWEGGNLKEIAIESLVMHRSPTSQRVQL
ncbi:hypothetical protein Goklo_006459 [Gossypium klotzschianum]|uniref:Uncharacterized protein n=1 Tax=Gossypium klotzschianum TaxID=34286 RepID=A0A7J8VIA9_9ROSI|nr:hypothetical protein [Gossypium klotzschianum]